ncbi:hypothetical protein [Okeania sp. SIO2B3]|uniref:hypothetical protein n=1 Tax=Okeania sp. SIO2B3 TaxID=2607784 RepID=UPI0013C0968F|nr:hypothetical protein [Okeania sp. SIO2B3]NET42338.1 hypothetical protein [Okeania sp. SIO2B3]
MEYEQDPKDILDISQEHTIVCSEELGNKYKDLNLAELLLKSEQEIKALAKMKPTVYTA